MLRLYNSLTNRDEDFKPIDPAGKRVRFYSCGPTVYDYAHIGNFRSFLNADVLRRTLELCGYEVEQVMNMTDVGHMTEDDLADGGGEDKMEVAARRLTEAKKAGTLPAGANIDANDPLAVANFYADAFIRDADALGLEIIRDAKQRPELMPRPTQYVQAMISMIETLMKKGHAYVADDGVVYFDIQSFPDYGQLSGNTPNAIRSGEGGRVDDATQELKRHPADFMLWKPDTTHLMRWPSPWGEGYPGWHIECSVMAQDLLAGDTGGEIDLHSGGEDNIFPHHECEIAQSRAATGADAFARYWFHTRFLRVEGEKMSKSKGNFFTLEDMQKKGASPAALRLELIKTHYRSHANFTFQGVKDCQRQIDRWSRMQKWLTTHQKVAAPKQGPFAVGLAVFKEALCSDLNVSGAIAALNDAAGHYDIQAEPPGDGDGTLADELAAFEQMTSVLGVLELTQTAGTEAAGFDVGKIESLIEQRLAARTAKDWAAADRIRDELTAMGIAIMDGPDGTTWKPNVA